jgi:hypothetical protein
MKNYLIIFLSIVLFGCATPPSKTPPDIEGNNTGTVIISNPADKEYGVSAYDEYYNLIFRIYVEAYKIREPLVLRKGKYRVCFNPSGFGKAKCYDEIVEVEKEHHWSTDRKYSSMPIKDLMEMILSR